MVAILPNAGKKIRIGIDIDGVLIDTNYHAFLEYCEKKLGWKISYEKFSQTHSWDAATGKSESEITSAFYHYLSDTEHSQKPIEGAYKALQKLGEIADIYLITARFEDLRETTTNFLNEHLGEILYKEISMSNTEKKAQRIREFNLDYFIDDSFREVSAILQDTTIKTKIIPFPSFHGQPDWSELKNDPRIIWLQVWRVITNKLTAGLQAEIHKKAWEEIVEEIVSPLRNIDS